MRSSTVQFECLGAEDANEEVKHSQYLQVLAIGLDRKNEKASPEFTGWIFREYAEGLASAAKFQTTDHPAMPRRMAGYIGRSIEHYGLPVYAHVLYLRPASGRRDPGYYIQEHPDYPVVIRYKVIRLSQLAGQAVLDREFVGLLPFAPLMQPPAGQTEAAWLEQCVARAAALPLDRSVKADFLAGLAILSGLVYNPQTIMAIVSKENLMDLIRESSFAQYLAENAREEGIKQGIEQGIEQGIQESIQEVLALRFQPEDMHSLASRIGAIDDVQRLKQLHRAAIQMPSLAAFRRLLNADE